ncbi:MAG TPA: hypothetical protein VII56_08000 [Rhizomicrobium sp.]
MLLLNRYGLGGLICAVLVTLPAAVVPAWGADDPGFERMAICQDSWLDWQKNDPARLKVFADRFHAAFSPHDNDPYFLPKANVSVAGLRVVQAYPGSVGMGVGFSLLVDATFDKAKQTLAKQLGKPLVKCDASDGMKTCELQIAEQRTITLMAPDDPKNSQTLIGCYYFYEK